MSGPATARPAAAAGRASADLWTRVLGVALVVFVASRCLVPMDETDVFYNLRLGEIILATHHVPRTNLLSFTFPTATDPNLAWLFQIVLALAHRAWGIPGTVILKTAFVVATFVVLFRVAIRRGSHPAIAAAVLALGAWAAEPRFVERPHLVTFLGLALMWLGLARAESGKPRLLWALIPLGVVWANGNSCFFLAPVLLALYAAGALVDGRIDRAVAIGVARRDARRALVVAVALVPLLFATPSGSGFIGYVANHFRMPSLRQLQEYRAVTWPVDAPYFFLLALGVATAGLSAASFLDRRHGAVSSRGAARGLWRYMLPIAALAALASRRVRFVAEFALLAAPEVAVRMTLLAKSWRSRRASGLAPGDVEAQAAASKPASTAGGRRVGDVVCGATLVALVVLAALPRIRAVDAGEPLFDIGEERGLVPWAAIAWLDAHGLRDNLYNDLEVGSALTWSGWPAHRVFQDPRINAYPADFHAVLRRTDLDRPSWDAFLGRFGVTSALVTYPDLNPRAAWFDPELWALVYRDADALVFVRRLPIHAARIAADELPIGFQADTRTGVTASPLDREPSRSPLTSCEWARRVADVHAERADFDAARRWLATALAGGPGCLSLDARDDARLAAGTLALRARDPAQAVELLAGLRRPSAEANLGFALIQLGRLDEALTAFDGAIRSDPADADAAFGRGLALARLDRRDEATAALRAFLERWPQHFAAPEAQTTLRRLGR